MAKAAILGFGTVGSGVAEVLKMNASEIAGRTGEPLELKAVVEVRDMTGSPWAPYVVKDFALVENDPEITVVAETIGGTGLAYEFTRRALAAKKNVVTSNKALVAAHGAELLRLAEENGVRYLFEASVGGGIPILRPLTQCLTAERIESICGILNGTTNYILTRMNRGGAAFGEALAEAQALGYAERDPSADIDGADAVRKICILANLAWGKGIAPEAVPVRGIRGIAREDVAVAAKAGYAVKLIARAGRLADGRTYAFVEPQLAQDDDPIAHINGVTNAVSVTGNAVGGTLFCGPGAGKLPTASAVVADMVEAVSAPAAPIRWTDPDPADASVAEAAAELPCAYYVRIIGGTPADLAVEGCTEIADLGDAGCAVITPVMPAKCILAAAAASCCETVAMRILPFENN